MDLCRVLNQTFFVNMVAWRQINSQVKRQLSRCDFLVQYLSNLHNWWTEKHDKVK